MSDICYNTLTVSGPTVELGNFAAAAKGRPQPYRSSNELTPSCPCEETEQVLCFDSLLPIPSQVIDSDDGRREWAGEHWGTSGDANEPLLARSESNLAYAFETRDPPMELFQAASANWTRLSFELRWSRESKRDGRGVYQFRAGDALLTEFHNGYFAYDKGQDALIHHRWIEIEFQADVARREKIERVLKEEGIIFTAEEPPGSDYWSSRHTAAEVVARFQKLAPGVSVRCVSELPFTLEEREYLASVYTMLARHGAGGQILSPIPEGLRPLLAIGERDLTLTDWELDWVVRGMIARDYEDGRVERLECLRNALGRERFDTEYRGLIESLAESERPGRLTEWFRSTGLPPEQSRPYGYGVYQPTREELEFVLTGYAHAQPADRRVAVIREAIAAPRWVHSWPNWERESGGSGTRAGGPAHPPA